MLSSIKVASARINEISTSLWSFARADSTSKVSFDINNGLENTLTILQHRLRANSQRQEIEAVKNYGDLPHIHCYPHTLNQVFMNLLVNTIESLEEDNYQKKLTYRGLSRNFKNS